MHSMARHKDYSFGAIAEVWFASVEVFLSTQTGKFMYAEAILDAVGGGRVVPGPAALLDSTNAAQREKRTVSMGLGGTGSIAALRRRGKPFRAVRRRRALHYPPIPVQPRHT